MLPRKKHQIRKLQYMLDEHRCKQVKVTAERHLHDERYPARRETCNLNPAFFPRNGEMILKTILWFYSTPVNRPISPLKTPTPTLLALLLPQPVLVFPSDTHPRPCVRGSAMLTFTASSSAAQISASRRPFLLSTLPSTERFSHTFLKHTAILLFYLQHPPLFKHGGSSA